MPFRWMNGEFSFGERVTFLGPAAAWVKDGTADWFWPEAEKAGLPVMFLAPGQSAAFASVAERHPRLQLIIDHMGINLDTINEGKLAGAIEATASLARYPNVSVKLSATPNYSKEGYPFRDFLPHMKKLFDAYGPQRSYWGTDMTNGFDRATYRQ